MTRLSLGRPRPLSFQAKLSYCVNHFEGIRFNNPFQGSFEHRQLQFDIAKFRLHRWGEAVTQYQNDHTISESDPNSQIALATLDGLLGAFDAIKMTAKRREFHITRGTPLTLKDHLHKDLHDWFMKVTTRTPTQHSTTGNQMCTLYQDSDAKRLLVDITTLIEELEQLFPVDKISLKLAQSAIDTIGNQPDTFRLLGSTAAGTDEVLGEAVRGKLGYFSGRNH
ncbi:hypothetical protein PLICBS_006583, partial [Purpureocillium lilacinum]|uniref:uncharacterized protein n=1 Tax=Purpureocillium lilacinum TaxID=33203 RepID=UPI0020890117